jgi:hypothetical protein
MRALPESRNQSRQFKQTALETELWQKRNRNNGMK